MKTTTIPPALITGRTLAETLLVHQGLWASDSKSKYQSAPVHRRVTLLGREAERLVRQRARTVPRGPVGHLVTPPYAVGMVSAPHGIASGVGDLPVILWATWEVEVSGSIWMQLGVEDRGGISVRIQPGESGLSFVHDYSDEFIQHIRRGVVHAAMAMDLLHSAESSDIAHSVTSYRHGAVTVHELELTPDGALRTTV